MPAAMGACRSFVTRKRKKSGCDSVCVPGTTGACDQFKVACACPRRDDDASQVLCGYGKFPCCNGLLRRYSTKWRRNGAHWRSDGVPTLSSFIIAGAGSVITPRRTSSSSCEKPFERANDGLRSRRRPHGQTCRNDIAPTPSCAGARRHSRSIPSPRLELGCSCEGLLVSMR